MSQDDMQPASPVVQAAFTRLKAIPAGQTVLNHDIIDDCDCVASYLLHTKFDDNSADILDDIQNGNVIIKIKERIKARDGGQDDESSVDSEATVAYYEIDEEKKQLDNPPLRI